MAEEPKPTEEAPSKDVDMEPASEKPDVVAEFEELDAPEDARKRIPSDAVAMSDTDSTMNAMLSTNKQLLMTLCDGGLQYLLAGVRANVGVKSGRYMFEVKIAEFLDVQDPRDTPGPQPRNVVRIGISTKGSTLLLSDTSDNVCFDNEGQFCNNGRRNRVCQKFVKGQTAAVVLNLDAASKNRNTITLYVDGQRACEPQPLPEHLVGQTLFPTITYRNVTLQVNLGPSASTLHKLPFSCRMVGDASEEDVELIPETTGKGEVVFPIGLPEHGYFEWVDYFLQKHPTFTEISDRKVFLWAEKSGLVKGRCRSSTNDKPEFSSGVQMLDDFTVRKLLSVIAPTAKRNYIIPELMSNMLPKDRKLVLSRFSQHDFNRVSCILLGEPDEGFRDYVHGRLLAEKRRKAQREKRWDADPSAEAKNDANLASAEKADEKPTDTTLDEEKTTIANENPEEKPTTTNENSEKTDSNEEARQIENKVKDDNENTKEDITLTDAEKANIFPNTQHPDVDDRALSRCYAQFSLPSVEEGFDEVRYEWEAGESCTGLMKEWIMGKKMTQRVEDLRAGDWFKTEYAKWENVYRKWQKIQSDWKDNSKNAETPEEEVEIDPVENVEDVANGEPLFSQFVYEDWVLLSLRYELHLLVHAFRKDLNDPDRPSFTEAHLAFYFDKYFRKGLDYKTYNVESFTGLLDLVKETTRVDEKTKFLTSVLEEVAPPERFVKVAEAHRRERQQRIDAGDETAKLQFSRRMAPPPPPARDGREGRDGRDERDGREGRGHGNNYRSNNDYNSGQRSYQSGDRSRHGSSGYGSNRGGGYQQKRSYHQSSGGGSYNSSAHKSSRSGYGGGGYSRR